MARHRVMWDNACSSLALKLVGSLAEKRRWALMTLCGVAGHRRIADADTIGSKSHIEMINANIALLLHVVCKAYPWAHGTTELEFTLVLLIK